MVSESEILRGFLQIPNPKSENSEIKMRVGKIICPRNEAPGRTISAVQNRKRRPEDRLFAWLVERLNFYFPPPDSFPISEKSGRYIDMTIEPIVTPRKAISTGSIIASRSAMAVSTSSS